MSPEPRRAPQRAAKKAPERPLVHLDDDIVRELKSLARPGKGEILVKVFAEAATAYVDEEYEEAVQLGEQAKHIALRSPTIRELLGLAFYRQGRWSEAARELAAFRRISGARDQNPVLADCYRALGKPDKAVELCDEIGPGEPEPIRYEGAIVAAGALADMRRLDEAIARLESLDLSPAEPHEHHVRAWYALADILERRGRFTQALSWFESAAAVDEELTDAPERANRLRSSAR